MHDLNICHRDLKPENILVKNDVIKICDLGSAKVIKNGSRQKNSPYVVSRYYRAPELLLASHKYGLSIDIWSVGCILFEIFTNMVLFPGDSEGH